MKPILYPAGETQFKSNGLGRLAEATKCLVTEERNGQYELEMQYPITGRHYKEIVEERIIAARHDDSDDVQPFRIYKITRPMNGIVTVSARHISYQLSKVAVMPFAADTCAEALAGMISHSVGDCPFTIWTDKLLEAHFSVDVPSSFRSLLGGVSGSILDIYGPGEYEWDKFTVKFHSHRGSDQAVMIRYGKNMTDVKKTTDTSNIWTGILPYWAGTDEAEQAVLVTLPEKAIYSDFVSDYVYKMVVPVDFSSAFQEQPTEEQLRSRAQSYVKANAADGIPASIDVSFVALWQTEEYKNWAPLQKLKLCDTVTVYHKGLGIENKAKIVSITYDVILERYEKMTIGEVKTSLGDSIRQISEEIKKEVPTNASVSQAISLATNILSGSTGGNIVINTNAKGQPVEILSMDTADIKTAKKIIKIDKDGISVSKAGYSGAFTVLLDMDGKLDAGILKEIIDAALIKKGVLSDKQSNVTWNMATGAFAGKKITITDLTAEKITVQSFTAEELSSGDGYTGTYHVDGATVTVRAGIITAVTPDPEEETPGGEEGENTE
ncbi:MAG: phage tail protein [Blautia sp.]|nr:phage tail protein [Blautia sp.]